MFEYHKPPLKRQTSDRNGPGLTVNDCGRPGSRLNFGAAIILGKDMFLNFIDQTRSKIGQNSDVKDF